MGFFRGKKNVVKPDYTALELQTSTSILPIPIVWGRNKLAGNVIWYQNFQALPQSSGGKGHGGKGGGGGGGGTTSYDYRADIIIALCEGPITSVGMVWKDQSIVTYLYLGLTLVTGTTPQTVWPYLAALYPDQALAYQGTAYLAAPLYDLGSSATIGNHNFEVLGIYAGTGANGLDADPALVINDFLTNAQYGAGFNPASISSTTLFGSGGDASLQTYCNALGLCFSPVLSSQEQASSILTRWLQVLSCAAVWSGGMLKFVPYADTAIASGAQTTFKQQFSIPFPVALSTGYAVPAYVTVSGPASFVSDGGVVYAFTNIPFAFVGAAVPTVAGTYGMTTSGTYIFAPADEGKAVVITYTTAASTSFAPNLAAAYALTDLDFVDEKGNKDPVQVERADVFSLPTIQRVEVSARGNQYAATAVEARDQAQIEIFGPRVGSVIQAHEICDVLTVAPLVAQTILQRELYVRAKFAFKLGWEYCLLDPMDIVTITDANLGLSNYPVRILTIEEDDKGLLAVTAEELVTGVSTPAFYQSASPGNFAQNASVPAEPINAPLIYQPPTSLTGGVAQVWVGASGINGGPANRQWGGANVYVSVDNTTYSQIAVLTAPLRQGFLTASLPTAAGWDSVDTLAVDLAESGQTLSGTSQAAAQAGATLSLVDSELLAYQTATLTSGNAYNLTGLARGLGGSSPAAHSTGAPFARLDAAIVKYNLAANFAGQTLYFKFQSFNVFGGGLQDLSTCVVNAFTPTAPSGAHPIAAQLASGFVLDLGQVNVASTLSDDFGLVTDPVTGAIELGQVSAALLLDLGLVTAFASILNDFGSTNDAVTGVAALGTVP